MDQKTLAKQMEIIHDAKRPNIDDLMRSADNEQILCQWMARQPVEVHPTAKRAVKQEFDEIEKLMRK